VGATFKLQAANKTWCRGGIHTRSCREALRRLLNALGNELRGQTWKMGRTAILGVCKNVWKSNEMLGNVSKSEEMRRRELKEVRSSGERRERREEVRSEMKGRIQCEGTPPGGLGECVASDGVHWAVMFDGQDQIAYPSWPTTPTASPSRGASIDTCRYRTFWPGGGVPSVPYIKLRRF